MKINFPTSIIALFFLFIPSIKVLSQGKNIFEVNSFTERSAFSKSKTGFGVSYERRLNNFNSIGIGIGYKTFLDDFSRNAPSNPLNTIKDNLILEEFLTIPLLYKYHFKSINVSVGPTVDIYIGWKDKSPPTRPWAYATVLDNKTYFGLMTTLSKSFKLAHNFMLEPGIRFNPIFSKYTLGSNFIEERKRQYFGIGISAEYKF